MHPGDEHRPHHPEESHADEGRADVVVVGGGLAGLAAAATAAAAGATVVLCEGHALGGRARVDVRGGYAFNRGPRALYLGGPAERVLQQLGVATDRGASPPLRGGTALAGDDLHVLPQGPGSLARTRLLPAREKPAFARRLAGLGRLDPQRFAGTSADGAVAALGLGPRGTDLARALVRLATYAAATDLLDGAAAIAQLQVATGAGVRYLDGGFGALADGLAARARQHGASVRSGVAVRSVVPADHGTGARVLLADGTEIVAGTVVLAAGGPDAAAGLLGGAPAAWASGLGPAPAATCLELGLHRPPPTRFVLGIDEPLYLSTHAPPADLAPEGGAVVHLMRYLGPDDDDGGADAHRTQLRALARRAGISDADVAEERFLARMTVAGGLPLATGGGLAGRPPVTVAGRPEVLVAGDWVGPEGLLADAALASGADAGRRAAARATRLAAA